METQMMPSPSHSPLETRLRKALACILLPGLALGGILGCGPATQTSAPTITGFSPSSDIANPSTPSSVLVTVNGSGFSGGISGVSIGGANQPDGTVVSDSQITFYVPDAAITDPIVVTTAGGTAQSPTNFTMVPAITSNPTISGPPSAPVTIGGWGLLGITGITFTSSVNVVLDATITSPTYDSLTFNVPSTATAGQYLVTYVNGEGAVLTSNFTVN